MIFFIKFKNSSNNNNNKKLRHKIKQVAKATQLESNTIEIWPQVMAPHYSTLAWKIPQTEEPGGLQSMGSLRVRHD